MRRFFAFLGALTAALVLSVPPQSVALQGSPRPRFAERVAAEGRDATGASGRSAIAARSRRGGDGRARRVPAAGTVPGDSLSAGEPAGSDSAEAVAAPEQSIAVTVQVLSLDAAPPYRTALEQNYPNPSLGTTAIHYSLGRPSRFTIVIYSVLGQRVTTLVDRDHEPGNYSVRWDLTDDSGRRVAPGVYIYRGAGGSFAETKKLIVR